MRPKHQRRHIFIDKPLQLAVMLRTVQYWSVCTVAQMLMVLFVAMISSSQAGVIEHWPQLWWHVQITLIASAVLLPIMLLDVLKLSHRWVGPIFRLRAALKSLGRGEPVKRVQFREGDFWQDLASDLNAVSAQLESRPAQPNKEQKEQTVNTPPLAVGVAYSAESVGAYSSAGIGS